MLNISTPTENPNQPQHSRTSPDKDYGLALSWSCDFGSCTEADRQKRPGLQTHEHGELPWRATLSEPLIMTFGP